MIVNVLNKYEQARLEVYYENYFKVDSYLAENCSTRHRDYLIDLKLSGDRACQRMSELEKQVFALKFKFSYGLPEISKIIGISLGSTKRLYAYLLQLIGQETGYIPPEIPIVLK